MTRPRITVITPSLNQGRYLERALCSVLDQGYDNLEYMIVDGGSTDDSVKLIRLYEDRLAWWTSQPDEGPAHAINKALARASGQIVGILSADNLYLPGTLDTVARRLTGDAAWLVGRCLSIGPSDHMIGDIAPSVPSSLASFLRHDSGLLPLASSFWKRELLTTHGAFDAALPDAFDYEYCCRLLAAGQAPLLVSEALVAHREHPARRGVLHTLPQSMQYLAAARRYGDRLPLGERYALWVNCDDRERILALAEAELRGRQARRFLIQQMLRRPWWLTHPAMRQRLLHGVTHPVPAEMRPAA